MEEKRHDSTELTGDSKTGAVRVALRERKTRLELRGGDKGEKPYRGMREWLCRP